jgi:hypothetical protein
MIPELPDPMPWATLALAVWPLWVAYAVIMVVGLSNWWARR